MDEQKNRVVDVLASDFDPLVDAAMCAGSRLSIPLGEVMVRSSATWCCRYFLYSKADESATITRQARPIPRYFKIFQITNYLPGKTCTPVDTCGLASLFPCSATALARWNYPRCLSLMIAYMVKIVVPA